MRREIICLDRFTGRLLVWTSRFEINGNDFRIAVTPLTFNNIDTFFCRQIDYGIWLFGRSVGIRFGKRAASQENQRSKGKQRNETQARHRGTVGSFAMRPIEFRRPRVKNCTGY